MGRQKAFKSVHEINLNLETCLSLLVRILDVDGEQLNQFGNYSGLRKERRLG